MTISSALESLDAYSQFVAETLNRPSVERSTVVVWSNSRYTGVAEGEVFFVNGVRRRMWEELDFAGRLIAAYGYEVYRANEKIYWYDDFPHPQDPTLATTFPHHKHVPPDIKHHRIPAPNISFERPNLPVLIAEIEALPLDIDSRGE
ncbi:toxin-antitoxin system TumE family protein [Roseiflexus castenholzii]|uniref:toxin-antitoxin system TumE family protein n=1 Tax=Roseiflexus castenholzii TaxID=120962 RepID=UPI0023565576